MSTAHNAINNSIGTSGTTTNLSMIRSASGLWQAYDDQTDTFGFYNNAGTPEAAVTANIGSLCTDTTNGDLYVKTTDTVNTGWNIIGSAASFSVVTQTFTVNGTYTPTAGMVYCQSECVGGGGAGGGSAATGAGQTSCGGGGGSGEYTKALFSAATIGASQAVTIGAAGAGASGTTGGTGGTSSLGALLTAIGGTGGLNNGPNAGNTGAAGGAGGTGGAGSDLAIAGQQGQSGIGVLGSYSWGGNGGQNPLGFDFGHGVQVLSAGNVGFAATGLGCGGGGGANGVSQVARIGGAGAAGLIVVTEWVIS